MENLKQSWLTKNTTLLTTLVLSLLLTIAFPLVTKTFDLTLLDTIADPREVREILAQMTQNQKTLHVWITATLDVAYPLAYGTLFAGSALRFFPKYGSYLAVPALLAIVTDLTEGLIQILALTDTLDLIALKAYVTPFKYAMAFLGLAIAVIGGIKVAISYIKAKLS